MKKFLFVLAIILFLVGTTLILTGFGVIKIISSPHRLRYEIGGALADLVSVIGLILIIVKDPKTKLGQMAAFTNLAKLDEKIYKRIKLFFIVLLEGLIVIAAFVSIRLIPRATIAITITLIIYLILGFSYYGWGTMLCILLKIEKKSTDNLTSPIWLGWAFTLFLFQILHFIIPITAYIVIPVFLLGIAISIPRLIVAYKSISKRPVPLISIRIILSRMLITVICIFLVVITAWIALRSMLPPSVYDTYLYHFNAIRWINTYPIIPGLGNLHRRLAFNQSFFVYVAALNFFPFFNFGWSLANSFLLLVLIVQIFNSLRSAISQPSLLTKHPFHYAPDLFLVPVIAYLTLTSDGLSSPTPDLASILLQLVIFLELMHGLAEWLDGQRNQDNRAFIIIILSATAITVKLSNLAFSLVMMGIVLVYVWKTFRSQIRGVVRIVLPAIILLLVWGINGFILSGAPLYPSTIGYLPVDWAVPRSAVVNEANWVYSWARQPDASPGSVLGNWDWLRPWFLRMSHQIINVVYPLEVFITFFAFAIILGTLFYFKKRTLPRLLEYMIFIPPLLGLLYWFLTAPDPRFAIAILWLLPICSSLVLLSLLQRTICKPYFILALIIVFAITNRFFITNIPTLYPAFSQISLSGWLPIQNLPLTVGQTQSGLVVYEPVDGDQCGDSPLPCTPELNPKLRLRNPGNIASGFTVSP